MTLKVKANDSKEYSIDVTYSKGVYVDVKLDDKTPIAGFLVKDTGEITSVWNDGAFSHSEEMFPLLEESLRDLVKQEILDPSSGYFFTFIHIGNMIAINAWSQRNWQHDMIGEWHRFYISVLGLISK